VNYVDFCDYGLHDGTDNFALFYLNITGAGLATLLISRMRDWNGNECCVRTNLTHAAILIFMRKSSYHS
jgi:hypothetical protein